jgi:hypothetical protein
MVTDIYSEQIEHKVILLGCQALSKGFDDEGEGRGSRGRRRSGTFTLHALQFRFEDRRMPAALLELLALSR